MIHLTSCLLVCLISAGSYDAAYQTVRSHWSSQRASAGQPHNQVVKPKSLYLEFNPVGDNNKHDHDHSQSYKPSLIHWGTNLGTSFQFPSHTSSSTYSNKYFQGAPKPGVHLSLSLPLPTTTTAPTPPPSKVNVNAAFSYLGPSQNNPLMPTPQKPKESNLASIINKFLIQGGQSNQNSQTHAQKQQDKVIFNPLGPQHSSHSQSGSFSNSQAPHKFWINVGGSTDGGGAAQTPVHHAVQNTVHYPPSWYQVHKPPTSDEDMTKDIWDSIQKVNGQLMIPLEKCPGFEKIAHILKGYHGHVHHHGPFTHGHVHHHGPFTHGHIHHHGPFTHGHIHHHRPHSHGHVYHHGPPPRDHVHGEIQTKPNYGQIYLNIQGTAPSPSQSVHETAVPNLIQSPQETNVQFSGVYEANPLRLWHNTLPGPQNPSLYPTYEQQPGVRPPQTNFRLHVDYPKPPDTQTGQSHFPYVPHGRH